MVSQFDTSHVDEIIFASKNFSQKCFDNQAGIQLFFLKIERMDDGRKGVEVTIFKGNL